MSRTRRLMAIAAVILIALASAIAVLPARWLMRVIPAQAPVAIVDASGSIWNGSALVAVGFPGARRTLPIPIQWRWRLDNGIGVEITHPWLDASLLLRLRGTQVALPARTLRLPADALNALGAPFTSLQPSGELQLRWPALLLGGSLPRGEWLDARWLNAGTAMSRIHPLGSYRLRLTSTGNTVDATVDTLQGALQIAGTGHWNGRKMTFAGTAQPAPQADATTRDGLQALLSALGRRSGDQTLLEF
jgi:general secretion pathway protein N